MNRNKKQLDDFVKYGEKHPEQRFWQLLRNWSGVPFVGISYDNVAYKDTFFFEEKTR